MNSLISFDFETQPVRTLMIDGEPWFVAADVCRIIGASNPTQALIALDAHQASKVNMNTLTSSEGIRAHSRGNPTVSVVSEGGLYKLVLRSKLAVTPGTVQHRFANFVVDELLPAIRRDGSYSLAGSDRQDLDEKRAYYAALPDAHRALADSRAEALRQIEDLIAQGSRIGAAIDAVAAEFGIGRRTLYNYRRATYMVGRSDWPAAMAPRWSGPRKALPDCHPEALKLFIDLAASPARGSDIYRRMVEAAERNGWAPIPCQRTMYRLRSRLVSRTIPQKRFA